MVMSTSRIRVLVGSVIVCLGSGTNYGYSAYAPQLGKALSLSHTQLNVIGLAGNMGVYLTSPFIGRVVDLKGPRILFICGFFLLLIGYGGIKFFYDLASPLSWFSFLLLVLSSFATGVGSNSGNTAAMNTTAKSFPDRMRATTTSTVAAAYGLSAFFFSAIAHIIFPGDTSGFLLVLAIGTSIPALIGLVTVKVVPHADGVTIPSTSQPRHSIEIVPERDLRRNSQGWEVYSQVVGPGGYERLTESDLEEEIMEASASQPFLQEEIANREQSRNRFNDRVELSPSRRASNAEESGPVRRHSRSMSRSQRLLGEHTDIHGWDLPKSGDFWVLFSILFFLSGTGLMYLNNVGSMAQALFAKGNPKFDEVQSAAWQTTQVSITSITNCLGRILFGSSADYAKNHYGWLRSYFTIGISSTFILSQLVLYNTSSVENLWIASGLLGLGYGGMFGLFPTIMIEWFGLDHFSQNWGFLCLAPVIAGNLFSLQFGMNLDAHARPDAEDDTNSFSIRGGLPSSDYKHQCLEGRLCYVDSIKFTTFACIVALSLSIAGTVRDRRKRRAALAARSEVVVWDADAEEDS